MVESFDLILVSPFLHFNHVYFLIAVLRFKNKTYLSYLERKHASCRLFGSYIFYLDIVYF